MNRAQRRKLLEAVAVSQDPSLSASERLRAIELLEHLGDEPETPSQAITAAVTALSARALDAELDALLAVVIRDGEIEHRFPVVSSALDAEVERRVTVRQVRPKVHVPPREPDPPPPRPIRGQMTLADAAPLASTYSAAYYERLGVPVAAELDHPDE
jgi:hypothetical protein